MCNVSWEEYTGKQILINYVHVSVVCAAETRNNVCVYGLWEYEEATTCFLVLRQGAGAPLQQYV